MEKFLLCPSTMLDFFLHAYIILCIDYYGGYLIETVVARDVVSVNERRFFFFLFELDWKTLGQKKAQVRDERDVHSRAIKSPICSMPWSVNRLKQEQKQMQ